MIITKIRTVNKNFLNFKVTLASSSTPFLALGSFKNKRIYISELFLETYSEEEQEAILAHEVGHLVLHEKQRNNERELVQELEADRYAVGIVGFETMASAIKKTIALSNKRYKEGLTDRLKYERQRVEQSHRISNLLDFIKGKTTTLEFAKKNLS